MVRMSDTGVPLTMLREQYRMHPHIAETVSTQFYVLTTAVRDVDLLKARHQIPGTLSESVGDGR